MFTVLHAEDILDKEGEIMIYNSCEIYNTAAHANTLSAKIFLVLKKEVQTQLI